MNPLPILVRTVFSLLVRILPFPGTHPDSTIFWYAHRLYPLPILVGTLFRYSHGFYLFLVLARILQFLGTYKDCTPFRYSSRQFFATRTDSTFSPVLTRILPFLGTHINCTFFRYSSRHFLDTSTDSTFSPYSPGFYNFWVGTQIVRSSDTRLDIFSVLAQILTFPVTRRDSTIF